MRGGYAYKIKSDDLKGVVVDPESKLEEEIIVRPTSKQLLVYVQEMDTITQRLPVLINQWQM